MQHVAMNRSTKTTRCVLAALILLSLSTRAQSSATYTLSEIHFTGLHRYTPEQAITASGLHIGDSLAAADLQSAAERLSKSGAFDSVSFQFSTRGNDLNAQFGVTETKDALPCIFDNFVWFTDADLDRVLRQHVTFYTGESPARGDSVLQIRSALQDLLRAHGISGEVSEIPYGTLGTVSALLFHVDDISQPIKSIAFSGEAAVSENQLMDASAALMNKDFSFTNVAVYASAALLPLYYQRGYLRSQFGRPKASLLDANSTGPVTEVSITLPVVEGNQYTWNGAYWSGNQALSAAELAKALGMNPQEVANLEKIDTGFASARKVYLARGYIDVRITPTRDLDDKAKLASYFVRVDEGSQFHMGQVYFDGVPDRAAAALLKKWKLKTGDIYDATYPLDFLQNSAARELVQVGSNYRGSALKEEADKNTLVVNVHIQFR
jgi:outer membrane protein assembly factor BamA